MDLRSIINTESGDSSIDEQLTPVALPKETSLEGSSSYHYPNHASLDKHSYQEYESQQSEIPPVTNYQQNYQYRRRPPLPIQVPTASDLNITSHIYPIMHQLSGQDLPQISGYTQNVNTVISSQSEQVSPSRSSLESHPISSKTPISHDDLFRSVSEKGQKLRNNKRDRSISSSPDSVPSSKQKKELSLDSEREKIKNPIIGMSQVLDSSTLGPELNQISNELNSKKSSSKTHVDIHSSPTSTQFVKKKKRYSEPPIWARSIKTHGHVILAHQNSRDLNKNQSIKEMTGAQSQIRAKSNGIATSSAHNKPTVVEPHPSLIIANWEESLTGVKPMEQMTKAVADFIYVHVVSRSDLRELSTRGVQIEIEAKLGELIDKDTNQRFFLPVQTECVLTENLQVGFKSSMTEKQHQRLNEFLNETVKNTHQNNPNAKSRVKIDYLHRREVDKFYDIPKAMQAALPPAIREQIPSHHSPKLRVTHDQKSKEILAKIVKTRISSLDIYGGIFGALDCRISINFEMSLSDEFDELIAIGKTLEQNPERNKDRLSYSQSYYQIDLTQVTQNILVNKDHRTVKEHELEIEISTSAVVDQGLRAARGDSNGYLPLIEGLLNNVRLLSRFVNDIK